MAVRTILTAAPQVIARFEEDARAVRRIRRAGLSLSAVCSLMYMANPVSARRPVITNSTKLMAYTSARRVPDGQMADVVATGRRHG